MVDINTGDYYSFTDDKGHTAVLQLCIDSMMVGARNCRLLIVYSRFYNSSSENYTFEEIVVHITNGILVKMENEMVELLYAQ